ncbi:antibiotic biosynthesis monooxygenase [Streptomyces sp. SID5785]|uniref:antibiotic biosynthesis monooxygenase family protein n=1 Tax=Streptomyces sp. SID5785 TaxID=2690309 RepID=UPI001361EA0B|nr:antibiotic biosynthesis monooxygenase family protein [Streptomyces sp. SID5785]MZD07785.1 antibiotic biosynthesis monooxygenase [Streptomyces sp. SID5785]
MTFRVMLRLEIEAGREAEFEKAWLSGTDAVTGHSANLGQSLSREPDGTYVIVSDWVDEPQFRRFEESPAHLEHRATLHPFRKGGTFHVMEVLHTLRGEAAAGAR